MLDDLKKNLYGIENRYIKGTKKICSPKKTKNTNQLLLYSSKVCFLIF